MNINLFMGHMVSFFTVTGVAAIFFSADFTPFGLVCLYAGTLVCCYYIQKIQEDDR